MTLNSPHFFLFPLRTLVNMVLNGILSEASESAGGPEQLARILRWKRTEIERLLSQDPPPELDGPEVLSMSLADIRGKSLKRAIHATEDVILMRAFEYFFGVSIAAEGFNRFIARLLGTKEWYIRRIKTRVARMGGLEGSRSEADSGEPGDGR